MPGILAASYSTVSACFVTLPELGSITTLTSAHVADAIGHAQAYVNARLAKTYALPFSQDIDVLQTLTTDLAIYRLLTRRLYTAERLQTSPWPDRYKEAITMLDAIAAGEMPLVGSGGVIVGGRSDVTEVWSTTKDRVPTFWEGPTGDHSQDAEKLEHEADRRDLNLRDRLL
jgi:phage gp36-like protein